jgi:transposase-like protein
MAGSIAVFVVAPIVAYASERGVSVSSMCKVLDTTPEGLRDHDARLSLSRVYALWDHLARELRDPGLPLHVVAKKRVEHLRILGFLVATSGDGWEALGHAIRYGSLLRTPGSWSLKRGTSTRIEWAAPAGSPELGYRICNEAAVAMFLRSLRLLAGKSFHATQAAFVHPGPADARAHDEFFGCHVEFGGAYSGFELQDSHVEAIVPTSANAALAEFFAEQAEALRARVDVAPGLTAEVRSALVERLLEGGCDMATIARRLGSHPRTLRRKLKAEGTSWSALLDDARREHATRLLGKWARVSLPPVRNRRAIELVAQWVAGRGRSVSRRARCIVRISISGSCRRTS